MTEQPTRGRMTGFAFPQNIPRPDYLTALKLQRQSWIESIKARFKNHTVTVTEIHDETIVTIEPKDKP